MKNSRKEWPFPFTQSAPIFDIDNWIKAFSVMWLTYLLFNTNNPLSNYLNPFGLQHQDDLSLKTTVLVIFGGILYTLLVVAGIHWAGGFSGLHKLFAKFRLKDCWFIFYYGLLHILFQIVGNYLTAYLPIRFDVESSNTLDEAQLQSLDVLLPNSIREFFLIFGAMLINIVVFLAAYQFFQKHMSKHPKLAMGMTYFISCLIAGGLSTTPINAHLFLNILSGGLAQLPLYWAYMRSRNVLVPTVATFLVNRFITLLIVWINLNS